MEKIIATFHEQFSYKPEIKQGEKLARTGKYIVVGMGGSHLAADLLRISHPTLDLKVHMSYGLPAMEERELRQRLVILSSYSGNTEEVIDAFHIALKKNLPMAVIAVGGTLLTLAKKYNIPYIQLPDTGIQPRMATGFSTKALIALIGDKEAERNISALHETLTPEHLRGEGAALAKKLKGFIPVVYAGRQNYPLAYNWKIKFNETGKIPAFCNMLPELNHNEMTGFSGGASSLSSPFHFIFLKDDSEHTRILKRFDVLETVYTKQNFPVRAINISHNNVFYKIFSTLLLADWTALYTAKEYGNDPEQVPLVEEFKKMMG